MYFEVIQTPKETDLPIIEIFSKDEYRTPPKLQDFLVDKFGVFDLDSCASSENTISTSYYTELDNSLTKPWWGNSFCNPPYSNPYPFVQQGYQEVMNKHADQVVMLLKCDPSTKLFYDFAPKCKELYFFYKRIHYVGSVRDKQTGLLKPPAPAMFPSMLMVF